MAQFIRALTKGLPLDIIKNDVKQEIAMAKLEEPFIPLNTRISRRLRRLRREYGLDAQRSTRNHKLPPASIRELFNRYCNTLASESQIQAALVTAPARHQEMIGRFLAGRSSSEIAAEFSISSGTVRGYIKAAMLQCQKRILNQPRYCNIGRRKQNEK